MTVTYGFYDSVAGDRKYNADQMSRMFDGVVGEGVLASVGSGLAVSAAGGSMNITVASGRAWLSRTWTYNDSNLLIAVETAEAVLNRIDTVVIEVNKDPATRANSIKIIKGTPGSSPVAPTLSNTSTLIQHPLADIYVGAGVTQILNANLTNRIGVGGGTPYSVGLVPPPPGTSDNLIGGWISMSEALSYVSADGATGVVNAVGDLTGKLSNGFRIKYVQPQALSAYWTFNTNSTPDVGSFTMGNIGTPTYTAGKFGNALTLNGTNQALSVTDHATLKPTGDFTVGAWIKTSVSGAEQIIIQSFSGANSKYSGFGIAVHSTNVAVFTIYYDTGISSIDFSQLRGSKTLTDGNWHYVVGTYRNNYMQLYVDGILEGARYSKNPGYQSPNYIRIGAISLTGGAETSWFNGQIDDLFLINGYALDELTIKNKYVSSTAQGTSNINVVKQGIITNVGNYSGGNTQITFWGGTDFNLVNATISNVYYSSMKAPYGFDPDPSKWSVLVRDATLIQDVSNTNVVHDSGLDIVLPIGLWDLSFTATPFFYKVAAVVGEMVGLSTLTNDFSDIDLRVWVHFEGHATSTNMLMVTMSAFKTVLVRTKTTYNLLYVGDAASMAVIGLYGTTTPTIMRAICSYL